MRLTRRDWLRLGFGSPAVLACGGAVPEFLAHSAAGVAAGDGAARGHILVVVELEGGNDGLNTVIPFRDDIYYRSRPRLSVPAKSVLKIDDHVGLNPAMRPFAKLLNDGLLAVVQGVGYPNPSRSHFQSMAIWHTGRLDATLGTQGWLSRYQDATVPAGTLDPRTIQAGGAKLAQSLSGGNVQVPTLDGLGKLERRLGVPASAARQTSAPRWTASSASDEARADRTASSPRFTMLQNSVSEFSGTRKRRSPHGTGTKSLPMLRRRTDENGPSGASRSTPSTTEHLPALA